MKKRWFDKTVKFINFSFVGTTTFAMQLFFTVLLTEIFRITYYFSLAIALLIAWSANFVFNMKYTFGVKDKVNKRIRKFILLAVVSSLLNWSSVFLLVEHLKVHYFIAMILVTIILSIVSFVAEEVWIFTKSQVRTVRPRPKAR